MPNGSPKELRVGLMESLKNMARQHGITIEGSSAQMLLQTLVEGLSKTNKVAILIDEYDHPIISKLNNLDIAEKNREELKGFFDTMKSLDNHIKFTFITGVSKFSQVSLFSALNNLTDITMSEDYAKVLGYTGNLAENFSLLQRLTLVLLKQETSLKKSLPKKRERAGWNNEYLMKVLGV